MNKRTVGIRKLKAELSAVLDRVRAGDAYVITDRDRPVALMLPFHARDERTTLQELVKSGRISWSGGKPSGSTSPPRVRGPSVADAVIEDRR